MGDGTAGPFEVERTSARRYVTRSMASHPVTSTQVLATLAELGEAARDSMRVRRYVDTETNRLMVEFTAEILADRLPPEQVTETTLVQFESPATWWEHFKQTYGGRWWLRPLVRRRPVRLERQQRAVKVTVDLRLFQAYPRAEVPAALGQSVSWAQLETRSEVL